ncbi:hypothetical protein F5Y12DRAFT_32987 [Xylaria sp. FL1777]|nr:hypothetical protein F5Y12DRAFT_32987 [Xylaria sp. FL1777]
MIQSRLVSISFLRLETFQPLDFHPQYLLLAGLIMASPEQVPQMNKTVQCGLPQMDPQRPASSGSDTDEKPGTPPRDIDSISIDSMESVPNVFGRRMVTFDNERTTTAYEAWELVLVGDRYIRQSWKSFCGIKFGTRWVNQSRGCVLTNAILSFDQGELADMHEDAIHGYKHKRGTSQEMAYEQNLANRVDNLPYEIYDKLQHLIDDKTVVTNRSPYRKREWHVVVLQPGEYRMTELLPERKRTSIFSWKKLPPITRTWFVVLRGEEVKSTKEDGGWKMHNRISNPWWRLDMRETKEERDQKKKFMKKLDKVRANRHQPLRHHRPLPVGAVPPRPGPPMGL